MESCGPTRPALPSTRWSAAAFASIALVAFAALPAIASCAGGAGVGDPVGASKSPALGLAAGRQDQASGGRADLRHAPGAAQARAGAGGRWELADKLSSLRKATPRSVSQHMSGDLEGEVLASDDAKAYPTLGPSRTLPPGAVLVEAHYRRGSSTPVVFFIMTKRPPGFDRDGGDWDYFIVEPDGSISERGPLPLCSRCHAEAPFDHVFGVAH